MLRNLRSLRTRLLTDDSGAVALEFAMVAAPFFFMLLAVLELALVFMVSSTLENATIDVARTIRTGAAQGAGATAASFRNQVCGRMSWLQSQCQANLKIDVRTYPQFQNQNWPDPVSNGSFNEGALLFDIGKAGDIVLVRAFYDWKLISPVLRFGEQLDGGRTVLTAITTFRNEPF